MRSCTLETGFRRFLLCGVPFSSLLSRRCTEASAFCSVRKKRGLAICSPVLRVANDSNPTSIPTTLSVGEARLVLPHKKSKHTTY